MSFSSKTKDEVAKLRLKGQAEKLAFLCAATFASGSLTLSREKGIGVKYVTESHNFAKLIVQTASALYQLESEVSVSAHQRLNARNIVVHLTGASCRGMLTEVACLPSDDNEEKENVSAKRLNVILKTEAARRCFIRGAFLGCGSVSDPEKGYHLELVCKDEEFAALLSNVLDGFSMPSHICKRKSNYIVYIKEGEKVSEFLTLIGAMTGTMEFEHARIVRELSNDLNRQRNFENANMQKAAQAAAQQLIDIELIIREKGMEHLPQRLRETAEFRINNPEATMQEMSEALGVGKSGVNHRLERISELAEELRLEKGKTV